jgi:hypothetical protein
VVTAVATVLTVVGDDSRRDVARARTQQPVAAPVTTLTALQLDAGIVLGSPGARRFCCARTAACRRHRDGIRRLEPRARRGDVARARTQQQGAPLEATPLALLLGANSVLGSPSSRQAAARLCRWHIHTPVRPRLTGTGPHRWFFDRIHHQVGLPPLDLLLGSACHDSLTGRVLVGPRCRL